MGAALEQAPVKAQPRGYQEAADRPRRRPSMAELTMEKTTPETGVRPVEQDSKPHAGPVARLLAGIARMAEEHAEYKLSKCDWRKISI